MITFVVTKMMDGDFKASELYFDKGGIQMVTPEGEFPVEWAKTLKEIEEASADSMYRGGMFLDLEKEDFANVLGLGLEDLNAKYGSKSISL